MLKGSMPSRRSTRGLWPARLLLLVIFTLLISLSEALSDDTAHSLDHGTTSQESQENVVESDEVPDSTLSDLSSVANTKKRIIERQQGTPAAVALGNNQPQNAQVLPSTTLYYSFQALPTPQPQSRETSEQFPGHDSLRKRDEYDPEAEQGQESVTDIDAENRLEERQSTGARQVWVTLNTCFLPKFRRSEDRAVPPQITVAYHTERGPGSGGWQLVETDEGLTTFTVTTDNSVMIEIVGPKVDIEGNLPWNFDIAASRDAPYHTFDDTLPTDLKLVDSDPHAALLITEGLANWTDVQSDPAMKALQGGPPLGIFANNINYTALVGLRKSFCAISDKSQIQGYVNRTADANNGVEMGLTYAQPSNILEEQFYVPGLNRSSVYYGQLATVNGTYRQPIAGGGGVLYPAMNFTTKTDENCAVVYNLTFCNQVNYAVPANPSRYSTHDLAALYDNKTQSMFQNFSYSLQQIPCNTTPSSQYSLAVTCDDCRNAYKSWLCAVTIPKCEDFSSNYNPNFLNWDGSPSAIATDAYTYDPSPTASSLNSVSTGSSSVSSSETESASRFQNAVPSASPKPHNIATNYLFPRNLAQSPVPNSSYSTSLIPPMDSLQQTWMATNSSRNNETIGELVQPGPYMEVLPCKDLCYDLVRMCPAALGFSCPAPGSWLESVNYGTRNVGKDGAPTCNAPGAVYYPNGVGRMGVSWGMVGWVVVVVGVMRWM